MPNPVEELERSSFRDPAGTVFYHEGQVYRRVFEAGREHYESLMQSGLYKNLTEAGLLVRHEEVEPGAGPALNGAAYVLKPEQVPFISYPYEWAFSALKDAALLTLEVQRRALEHGLILKDASAYNVQFLEGRPVLIDTLSFEPYASQRAWQAYGQFCRHFLAPLALMSKVDVRLGGLLREHVDGVPLDLATQILPLRRQLKPGMLLHLTVHSSSQKRFANKPMAAPAATPKQSSTMAKQSLLGLTDSLMRTVKSLTLPKRLSTEWGEYYTFTNYSADAAGHKAKLVADYVKAVEPQNVWDIGGNDGRFTREALAAGAGHALCFDVDPVAVEKNYRQVKQHPGSHLFPLLLDATNPSPAIGWANRERSTVPERRQPHTLVMALAIIHHLAISNNLPFGMVAEWLASLGEHLVIEFVPKDDSKVQTLLATRKDIFEQYTREQFEAAFKEHYEILQSHNVAESQRVMYLMRVRRRA